MAKTKTSKQKQAVPSSSGDATDQVFAAVIEAGFLMAMADEEADDDELATIKEAIRSTIEADDAQIDCALQTASKALERDGLEARVAAISETLRKKKEAATLALQLAAAVSMSSDGGEDEDEEEGFGELAKALGFNETDATKIWEDVAAEME